jgi:Zn-dependent peptidase ImmA (M78 family)
MAVRRQHIRALVDRILLDHNITRHKVPIDVDSIAQFYGIEIKRDDVDDGLSGFLVRSNKSGKAVIGVNRKHHPNRQRFTIAHELGHFLLHENEVVHFDAKRTGYSVHMRNEASSEGNDDLEREANLFAAELLMPARFLQKDALAKSIDLFDEDALEKVAEKYEVSTQALTYRLANLGFIDS